MSFYRRYELARLILESEAKTFAGVQRDTGRPVFLHLLGDDASKTEASGLGELIRRAEKAGAILDSGEFAGTRYYVTEPAEPFEGLRAWLDRSLSAPASPPPAPKKMEAAPAAPIPSPPKPVAPAPPPVPRTTQPGAAPPAHAPGEFTMLFGGGPLGKPAAPVSPPPKAVNPALSGKAPSEFSTLFGAGEAPGRAKPSSPPAANPVSPPPPPPPPSPAKAPSEFSALFAAGESPASPRTEPREFSRPLPPPEEEAPAPKTTSPPPLSGNVPSEFSSLFGSGGKPAAVNPAPPGPAFSGNAPSEFSSLFGGGGKPAAPPAPAKRDAEIDDFERAFRQAPAPPPPPAPAQDDEPFWPEQPPPRAGKGPAGSDEGQFTRFFGNAIPGEELDIAAEQAKHAHMRDEPSPFQAAGGFTRVFGPAPGARAPMAPPPPANAGSLSASRLFSEDEVFARAAPADSSPVDRAIEKPADREPGEYTRMFGSGADAASESPGGGVSAPQAAVRPMAPASQMVTAIATPSRGRRIVKIVLIVLGTAAGMAGLLALIYLVLSRFSAPH